MHDYALTLGAAPVCPSPRLLSELQGGPGTVAVQVGTRDIRADKGPHLRIQRMSTL